MTKSFWFEVIFGSLLLNIPACFSSPKPVSFILCIVYFLTVVLFGMWIGTALAMAIKENE